MLASVYAEEMGSPYRRDTTKFPILKESFLQPLRDQRLEDGVGGSAPRTTAASLPDHSWAFLHLFFFAHLPHHQRDLLALVYLLLEGDVGICWCLETPGQMTQISCWAPVINSFRNCY